MLVSLIINFFALIGRGLVWLCYKKEGMKACKTLGKNTDSTAALFGLGLIIWIPSAALAIMGPLEGHFFLKETLYALGYLAIYLVWFGFTVKKIPKLIADAEALTKQNTQAPSAAAEAKPGSAPTGWRCSCGKEHPSYVSSCSCGKNKTDF